MHIKIATNGNFHVARHVNWCTLRLPKPLWARYEPGRGPTITRGQEYVAPEVDLRKLALCFPSAIWIIRSTLALKTRRDITRNPIQGYQWPQNRTCVCVDQKYLKKKTLWNTIAGIKVSNCRINKKPRTFGASEISQICYISLFLLLSVLLPSPTYQYLISSSF